MTPYMNREQLTSGTLAFAVGTGKAVVSTPYWAAEEVLADGRGELISFGDHKQLSEVVIRLLREEPHFFALRRRAYEYGRDIIWPVIGKHYWKMFSSNTLPIRIPARSVSHTEEAMSILEVPEPPLDHLIRMSDDTGLYQHAKFTIPDREHGYCTDDNARSLVAMTKYYAQYADPEALRLFDTYLSFVYHANNSDGTVRNFMTFDRQWIQDEPAHDSLGRTLWAFGTVMSKPPLPRYLPIIKEAFDRTSVHVPKLSMRGKSYSIFGMAEYLTQFPGASEIKRLFAMAADELVDHYERNSDEKWQWFEDIVTYDNAVLPHALYVAFMTTGNEKYLEVAEKTCNFLMENTYDEDHFSFV
ncbi:MAG: glycosyl transferase family 1, partial [Planctomycetes bacterium]|nr:glycosyl transferase family 1 [Planctomycetota bacterium]